MGGELLGDMMINAYYFIMSIYGWYVWTRKKSGQQETQISYTTKNEKKQSVFIFITTMIFVVLIYLVFCSYLPYFQQIQSVDSLRGYVYNSHFLCWNVVNGETKNRKLALLDCWRYNFRTFIFLQRTDIYEFSISCLYTTCDFGLFGVEKTDKSLNEFNDKNCNYRC